MAQAAHPNHSDIQHYKRIGKISIGVGLILLVAVGLLFLVLILSLAGSERSIDKGTTFLYFLLFTGMALPGLFYLLAGRAALKGKPWSRYVLMALGVIFIWGFPLGTILGTYTLMYYFPDKSEGYFKN